MAQIIVYGNGEEWEELDPDGPWPQVYEVRDDIYEELHSGLRPLDDIPYERMRIVYPIGHPRVSDVSAVQELMEVTGKSEQEAVRFLTQPTWKKK